VETQS
jgi:hypothetical protein